MSCRKYENEIALYAGGDLPAGAVPEVEGHLEMCSACRDLLAGLHADLEALSEEPVSEVALARMRAKVMERVAAPRRTRGWWWLAPVPLGVAAALAWILMQPPLPSPPVAKPYPVPVPEAPKAVARAPRRVAPHRRPPAPKPQFKTEPLLVKLQTEDPNVVIYWIVEKGDD